MTLLSPHELADCVLAAGFRNDVPQAGQQDTPAVIMLAVCLGESAARTYRGAGTEIMGRSDSGAHVGNWDHGVGQISGKFHYDKIIRHGGNWRDPYVNLKICFEIYTGAGSQFGPWHIFTSGAHVALLPDARIAVAHPWRCPVLEWVK